MRLSPGPVTARRPCAMVAHWLLGVGILATTAAAPGDLAEYEAVKQAAGRSAEAQIKLALWCEAHGLSAERIKHLATAVLSDPTNATARGLLGVVSYRGRWERPEAVSDRLKADESAARALATYNARRDHAPDTAEAQWKL